MESIRELPEGFIERMKELLGEEYELLAASFDEERSFGLRINPLKTDITDMTAVDKLLNLAVLEDATKERIPWCEEGFYYTKDSCPGRSPFHEAGAYYIQEPSAMAVVTALDPKPGERICDLCAAPGGKTTHIAGKMQGRGVLVSNEIVPERASILARNVERMGIRNCMVTNMAPDALADKFTGYFDRVVVDAPCSGEGMFRKDDTAISEWSIDNVRMCFARQLDILDKASEMVACGGVLVYSTCTFEPEENERVIVRFLEGHPDWRIAETGLDMIPGHGRAEWISDLTREDPGIGLTTRAWPHRIRGEGHFIAKLIRTGSGMMSEKRPLNADLRKQNRRLYDEISQFLHTELGINDDGAAEESVRRPEGSGFGTEGILTEYGEHIYMLPEGIVPDILRGLKVISPGLEIAVRKKNRLEPAHALAMTLRPEEIENRIAIPERYAVRYLRGETVTVSENDITEAEGIEYKNARNLTPGKWYCLFINGYSIGWAKYASGILKNHYPKGLRRNLA